MVSIEILIKNIRTSKSKHRILNVLKKEPCYIREIAKKLNIFPSAILKHIRFLEGLITCEVMGKEIN